MLNRRANEDPRIGQVRDEKWITQLNYDADMEQHMPEGIPCCDVCDAHLLLTQRDLSCD